jgi:hypothetical protein
MVSFACGPVAVGCETVLKAPRDERFDSLVVLILLPMTALRVANIFAILLAFISGGPGLATLFGITLVMCDGSEVDRGRALFRSFVSSVPSLAASAAMFLSLDKNH